MWVFFPWWAGKGGEVLIKGVKINCFFFIFFSHQFFDFIDFIKDMNVVVVRGTVSAVGHTASAPGSASASASASAGGCASWSSPAGVRSLWGGVLGGIKFSVW